MIGSEIIQAAVGQPVIEGLSATQEFNFPAGFSGFSGHFPGYPILPAVVQMLTGQLLAEQVIGRPLRLLGMARAKFIKQLQPEKVIEVAAVLKENSEGLQARVKLSCGGEAGGRFYPQA